MTYSGYGGGGTTPHTHGTASGDGGPLLFGTTRVTVAAGTTIQLEAMA